MRRFAAIITFSACAVLLAGCTMPGAQAPQPTPTATPQATPVEQAQMEKTTTSYTLDQVAQHKTKDDCWMSIEGKVYDVTPVTSSGKHPGGPSILQGCGTDATKLFMNRPNDKGPHPEEVKAGLQNFLLGDLEQ
jgi:cytochrome b involved in lipid metabolism